MRIISFDTSNTTYCLLTNTRNTITSMITYTWNAMLSIHTYKENNNVYSYIHGMQCCLQFGCELWTVRKCARWRCQNPHRWASAACPGQSYTENHAHRQPWTQITMHTDNHAHRKPCIQKTMHPDREICFSSTKYRSRSREKILWMRLIDTFIIFTFLIPLMIITRTLPHWQLKA